MIIDHDVLDTPRIARRRGEEERGDMLSSASDDEVGGFHSAICAERASAGEAIKMARTRFALCLCEAR